jgi:hypothetical protein
LLFGEIERVGKPGASAAFDADAQLGLLKGQILVLDDGLDLLGRSFTSGNRHMHS